MIFQRINFLKILPVTFLIVLFCISPNYALETVTHEDINEYIARNTLDGFPLNSYLKDQLGIQEGIDKTLDTKKVWEWLREGGFKEDIPYWYMPWLRSVNHFHNPLTDQGFSGIWGTVFLSGESSIQWSQKPLETQNPGGYYSWHDVRDYFYKALTATDKTTREKNFANTFRGLGQLMHLVEDLSVPEHTRDDGHYVEAYETWIEGTNENGDKNVKIQAGSGIISINDANVTPIFFDSSAIGNSNPLASVPVANLFDTNQYNGVNPNVTLQSNIGLSEYTNANFLSPDTMFTADFPYPDWSSVVEYDEVIDAVTGKKRTYLKKLGNTEGGYGDSINHLAAGKWFYKYLPYDFKRLGLKLDEKVYADYASLLIPRAVGNSAGLLNYFFRGRIEAVNPEPIYDGFCNNTGIKLSIKNNTPYEAMGPGSLIISYQYKLFGSDEFIYGTSNEELLNESIAPYSMSSSEFIFNFNGPIPADAQEVELLLIFKGKLGNEGVYPYNDEFAVVAQVIVPEIDNCSPREFSIVLCDGTQEIYVLQNWTYVAVSTDHVSYQNICPPGYRFAFMVYPNEIIEITIHESGYYLCSLEPPIVEYSFTFNELIAYDDNLNGSVWAFLNYDWSLIFTDDLMPGYYASCSYNQ